MVVDAPAAVAYKLYADREMFPKWMPFLSSVEVFCNFNSQNRA